MFEDILGPDEAPGGKDPEIDIGACPNCGSTTIEEDSGVFASKKIYIQTMACQSCSAIWKIHYNEDLEVVHIEY
jgi:transcription elongation factor Elf1